MRFHALKCDNVLTAMASSSRSRAEKGSGSEVHSARNKLDGVLQTLMDKTEDSTEPSDEECAKFAPEILLKELSMSSASPSKRSFPSKSPRKRRRKDDSGGRDSSNGHFSCVMKLFDRSVDLAKFNEDTPLYPICRAWMYNEPYNGNLKLKTISPVPDEDSAAASGNDEQDENKRNVYSLPGPLKVPKNENSVTRDIRIPEPLPAPEEKLDIYVDSNNAPSKETLLMKNMARWKFVRQR